MDTVDRETRSRIMAAIGSVSAIELMARAMLRGLRLRHQPKGIYGNPDFANKKAKIAVFVHGCFFHQPCPNRCSRVPKTNSSFWKKKFKRNIERHTEVAVRLRQEGWEVIVVWECEIKEKKGKRGNEKRRQEQG